MSPTSRPAPTSPAAKAGAPVPTAATAAPALPAPQAAHANDDDAVSEDAKAVADAATAKGVAPVNNDASAITMSPASPSPAPTSPAAKAVAPVPTAATAAPAAKAVAPVPTAATAADDAGSEDAKTATDAATAKAASPVNKPAEDGRHDDVASADEGGEGQGAPAAEGTVADAAAAEAVADADDGAPEEEGGGEKEDPADDPAEEEDRPADDPAEEEEDGAEEEEEGSGDEEEDPPPATGKGGPVSSDRLVHLEESLLINIAEELTSPGSGSFAVMYSPARNGGEPTTTWYKGGERTVHGPDKDDDLKHCLKEGTIQEKAIRVYLQADCEAAEEVKELHPEIAPRYTFNEAVVATLPIFNFHCFPAKVKKYPKSLEEEYPTPKNKSSFGPNKKGQEDKSNWTPTTWQINTIDDRPRGKLRDSEPNHLQRPDEYRFQHELAAGLSSDDEEDEDEDEGEGGAEVDTDAMIEEDNDKGGLPDDVEDEGEDEDGAVDTDARSEEDNDEVGAEVLLRNAGADKNILNLFKNIGLLHGVLEIEVEVGEEKDCSFEGRKVYVALGNMTVHAEATRALLNHQGSSFELAGFTYDPRSHKWQDNNPKANTPTSPTVERGERLRAARAEVAKWGGKAEDSRKRLAGAEESLGYANDDVKRLKRDYQLAKEEQKSAEAERDAARAENERNTAALESAETALLQVERQ